MYGPSALRSVRQDCPASILSYGLLTCKLSRNVLATLWRDKLQETFHSVIYPAMAKVIARQVARAVAESRIRSYFSCNLSRNDFGRCRVCHTVKCFVQLVPPQCRQNIARQVARNISQCSSAFSLRCKRSRSIKELRNDFPQWPRESWGKRQSQLSRGQFEENRFKGERLLRRLTDNLSNILFAFAFLAVNNLDV